jgi:hypothetical protein
MREVPWKSGASAPRKAHKIRVGFSPRNALGRSDYNQRVEINSASGEGAIRRSAAGLQRETFFDRRIFPKFRNAANLFPAEACGSWLRMGPVGRRHRPATIVVTAAGIMNRLPRRIRHATAVAQARTVMRRLADTAGMRLPRRNRQRQRDEVPHQHEQQQKSGSQAMHIPGTADVSPAIAKFAQHNKIPSRCKPTLRWLTSNLTIKFRSGCPISRVLCEKWGF